MTISRKRSQPDQDLCFSSPPIPLDEAREKWPSRFSLTCRKTDIVKNPTKRGSRKKKATVEKKLSALAHYKKATVEKKLSALAHYKKAIVNGVLLTLGDDVSVQVKGEPYCLAKIIELFEELEGEPYFRAQWFFKSENTVIQDLAEKYMKEKKRVFLSNVEGDIPLSCILSKVKIVKIPAKILAENEERDIPCCDYYYDMRYELEHLTFSNANNEIPNVTSDETAGSSEKISECVGSNNKEKYLLDLYSGCGAMSTGLCMGASLSGVNLITKWAVDINKFACKSLKNNHPETEVRNETTEDFLSLLKEWRRLCQKFSLIPKTEPIEPVSDSEDDNNDNENEVEGESDESELSPGEFEVEELLSICYGDPKGVKASTLHFKVRWKGYGSDEDTWEPYTGLGSCKEKLKEFVTKGFKEKLLPLPEEVHILCGGPPSQGISGHNRYRNVEKPLDGEKNCQLVVYMDIIDYLKPKYVLMENVVDLLKFAKGFLARYAVARLVTSNYQTKLGVMAAGSYGVPQCRNRVFIWGAQPTEKLPPYPLPTHIIVNKSKGVIPILFKKLEVGYNMDPLKLKTALTLGDAIRGLPEVTNFEKKDERNYDIEPDTDFQKFISLARADTLISNGGDESHSRMLYDHQPLQLNEDDFARVTDVRKIKGANFTDLVGLKTEKRKVLLDPSLKRVKLKSGKPLIPNYAIRFRNGSSKKPFGRVWWDEIVNTVVTRAEPHNQCLLHPLQDRVLTVRELARLQGFPDCYRLYGEVKHKYVQVGNAVAFPVGIALGYAYGMASQRLCDDNPVIELPFTFPECLKRSSCST